MLLVPERRGVFPDLSVRDNLEVFAGSRNGWDAAVEAFPILRERLDQPAGLMSGGEQQMLAMSRALLRATEAAAARRDLARPRAAGHPAALRRRRRPRPRGTTVILVEQHLSDALRLADVVYVLSRGEVTFAGEPAELIADGDPRRSRSVSRPDS